MFKLNNEQQEEKPYKFASGGIDSFIGEFQTPKQEQDIDENAGFEELDELQPEQKREPLEQLQASAGVANATASLLTIALDSSLSTMLAMFAGDDSENYKADSDQRDELEKGISRYLLIKGVDDIPPGVALLILVVSIYGGKGAMAFQVRKLNKLNEEKDRKIKELTEQLKIAGYKSEPIEPGEEL